MGENTELEEEYIEIFPGLSDDEFFRITSEKDPNYNCIAWAFRLYDDRWMQPPSSQLIDGIWFWWPDGVRKDPSITAYIEAFESDGYEICESFDHDSQFVKIALYINESNNNCTHAARQKLNGKWMSKLGPQNDIEHGTPHALEGECYGKVHCIMKKHR